MGHNESSILTSARAIVECMKIEAIEKVFCVPGESYLPVMDAILNEPSMKLVSARHEGGASFMAEGYAKATGKPGVVMATRGVGGSNLAIGVHTAYQDSTPLVVFLGQVHSSFRGREGFQEIDLAHFFSPITKWTVEIDDPARIPELVQRAFRIAQTGRPGPVVVSLPEDLLTKKTIMEFQKPTVRPRPAPSKQETMLVEKYIQNAERPLIIAGGGVKMADAEDTLIQFAEKCNIPVMAAFRRHDVFPNDHRLYAGHLGLGTDTGVVQTVKEADFILSIGTRLSEITTQDYTIFNREQTLVHMDINDGILGKVFAPNVGIVADAKEGLEAFLALKVVPSWNNWTVKRREVYQSSLSPTATNNCNHRIIGILQTHLPGNAIITNDAGNFAGWLHRYYQFNQKQTYIGPTSGAMGYGLPAAIGAKLAHPGRTVVSLSGDGGFLMTMQELETAVRYNIPVISIVFNNRMYGTIRMHQEMRYPFKTIGTDLGNVPFADMAVQLGVMGFYVKTPEEFEQALIGALECEEPALIEIESDAEQISVSSTINQIRQRSADQS
ncbi:thiamine pyrophosphate-dependent enzyme [Halobacillus sp. K22]|uniref:thiamine pyrophosphate-dependent enzyme n=1 Tax=Halobacillus sp. K22 TaxID=3457431 RepID=UPI003FCE8CC3